MQYPSAEFFNKRGSSIQHPVDPVFLRVFVVVLFCLIAGVTTAYVPAVALVIAGASVVSLYLARSLTLVICAATFLTMGTYRGVFLTLRFTLLGIPISVYDVLWLLVLLKIFVSKDRFRPVLLPPPAFLFLVSTILIVVLGILWHQQPYDIVKMFRAQLFLLIGYMAARSIANENPLTMVRVFILGGALTAVLQIVTFAFALRGIKLWSLLGLTTRDSADLVYFQADISDVSVLRDNDVTIIFAVLGSLLLIGSFLTGKALFRKSTTAVLLSISVVGVLLSFTRTAYVVLVLGILVLLIHTGRLVLPKLLMLLVGGSAVLFLIGGFLHTLGVPVEAIFSAVGKRASTMREATKDVTVLDRLNEVRAALDELGSWWWIGKGAAALQKEGVYESRAMFQSQIHNGYVGYLLAGGALGLGSLLFLIVRSIKIARRRLQRAVEKNDYYVASGVFVCSLALAIISLVGGVVNDAFQSSIFGVFLGLGSIRGMRPAFVMRRPNDV